MTPQPTWFSHPDLMQVAIFLLFAGFMWFLVRTLKKIDLNQTDLYNKYNDVNKRLSNLEGQHEARTQMKSNC